MDVSMSIIMAAGNCNEVIIMSDGRWSGEGPNGERIILDENFKKITKLNDKLYIAFAGNLDDCLSVIKGASKTLSNSTSVEQYTSAVMNWIQENVDFKHVEFNAQIIIAGCNSFGKLKINVVRCYEHDLSSERNNLSEEGQFRVCSALDPSEDFITPLMQQGKPLITQMMEVVKEAAKREFSINDHIFYDIITART